MTLPILLTLAGFTLVIAEILFPSLGAFGIASTACIAFADWIAWHDVGPGFMWVLVAVQIVGVPLIVKFSFWVLPKTPFGKGMILPAPPPEPSGGVEPSAHLLGKSGVALTELRPSGTARIGEERRSVVAEAGSVEPGTAVTVVAVEGYRIVVRPVS